MEALSGTTPYKASFRIGALKHILKEAYIRGKRWHLIFGALLNNINSPYIWSDLGILVRFSWMFRGFGKVFVDIYLLFGNVGYILLVVYSTPLYNKPHTYGWYEGGLLRKGCCGKVLRI